MQPYEEDIELLDSIPVIGRNHTEQLLAEIGLGKDISKQFPTAAHLCSWAGMVPRNNEGVEKNAVGHTTQTIVYHLLIRRQSYIELGADYFVRRKKDILIKQAIKRLELLGCKVPVKDVA